MSQDTDMAREHHGWQHFPGLFPLTGSWKVSRMSFSICDSPWAQKQKLLKETNELPVGNKLSQEQKVGYIAARMMWVHPREFQR